MKLTNEMLCLSTCRVGDALAAGAEVVYQNAEPHVFSPEFEEKMERLLERVEGHQTRQVLKWAAAILLALLLAGGSWLAVDTDARAGFIGWVKELYEQTFLYRYSGEPAETADGETVTAEYTLSWVPEGYEEFAVLGKKDNPTILYQNEKGERLQFYYTTDPLGAQLQLTVDDVEKIEITVRDWPADLFLASNNANDSTLVWTENNVIFYVSGKLTEENLIQIAESVKHK